jgi:hypothetical protein
LQQREKARVIRSADRPADPGQLSRGQWNANGKATAGL